MVLVINLGSDINFKEINFENIQKIKDSSTINIDLTNSMTNTYKAYQKKKNEKRSNLNISPNELPLKGVIFKQYYILPDFSKTLSNNNNSFHKKNYQSIDYEYINLKKK